MATIAIAPFHWAADLHSSFGLARKLEARGHRVVFLGVPDAEARVQSQGFTFHPIFASTFPPGAVEEQYLDEVHGRRRDNGGFLEKLESMCRELRAGEVEKAAASVRPDLFLVSSWTPWTAIAASRTGAPVVSFSSTLISVPDPIVPPFSSPLSPGRSPLFRARTAWAWHRLLFGRKYLGEGLDTRALMQSLARDLGYRPERIDFRVETWPRLDFPEIVFCPQEFDFPRARLPGNVRFVEASIDLQRVDGAFGWESLDGAHPLVYCSPGTVLTIKFRSEADRFLQAFLDAMATRPAWQGVATIGCYSDPDAFRIPSNVSLVREAPQLEVLRRAVLHVTHAGLTSVKESVYFGVPMIAAPRYYDQKGNAARIEHHGLGLLADWRTVSAEELGELMDRIVSEPRYQEAARRMSRTFQERESRSPAGELVEELAG